MLQHPKARDFRPEYVVFASWYSGLDNLKRRHKLEYHFLTRLQSNCLVNPDKSGLVEVKTLAVAAQGQVVHLKGFGLVRVFQHVRTNREIEQWATNDVGKGHNLGGCLAEEEPDFLLRGKSKA